MKSEIWKYPIKLNYTYNNLIRFIHGLEKGFSINHINKTMQFFSPHIQQCIKFLRTPSFDQ